MLKYFDRKSDIKVFHDDNLDVLRQLSSGSINLIYCDILYNTGKTFDDYNDNLGSPKEAIEWYFPRFREMKRVLANNGSIFIHCNWRLDSYIRVLMDDLFGCDCFRNRIYRKHSGERGFYSNFDSQVDIILYYVKNPKDFTFNEVHVKRPKIVPLFENGFIKGRDWYKLIPGYGVVDIASQNKHWLVSHEQLNQMMERNEVRVINDLPYRFTTAASVGNLWDEPYMLDQYSRTNTAEAYDTPKPDAVLGRIITMCSNEGDTVADFFMGGGTTAVIAKKLNRKGIFCDISEKACEVTIQKLKALDN